MVTRRTLLASASLATTLTALSMPANALPASHIKLGRRVPFSFDGLIERARAMASQSYAPPAAAPADILNRIDYDAHGKIRFDAARALFAQGPGRFPITFFHPGALFQTPVRMHVVKQGQAREILYDASYFDLPADSPARKLPPDIGFAGFRLQESRLGNPPALDWKHNDWAAFLGASYFRAIGDRYQYGLSARGIALNVAQAGKAEEFPHFTHAWFDTPANDHGDSITLYTLLDSPSIVGAYRFILHRGQGVVMEIDTALFLRRDIERFGIAPATSMYWFSESAKGTAADWRPEVHDSDGLALWTGSGERIWRALNNPPRTMTSAFADYNPRGFGLLQRDHDFNDYQDGVHYERRPSLWIEPLEDWGEGAVQLVEIPTDDEIHDNIVAMWVPKMPARAGHQYRLRYRLHWQANAPYPTQLAHCVATRLGNGGQPGQPRPRGVRKFMVEFKGGPLATLPFGVKPEAILTTSRGAVSYVLTEAVPNNVPGHWRTQFDLTVDGVEPVEMRLFLRIDNQTLSETWLYQYHPFQSSTGPVAA